MIKISYDKAGDLLEIRFADKAIRESEYLEESGLVIDYDQNNHIVAVEVTSFSKRAGRDVVEEVAAI